MVSKSKGNYWEKEMLNNIEKKKISFTNEKNHSRPEKQITTKNKTLGAERMKKMQLEASLQNQLI